MAGTWQEVAAGEGHTCAIRVDGSLYCWGRNDQGQLGIGSMVGEADDPTLVPGTWKHVATLFETTCAIDGDDVLWCWGLNIYGQAGTASPGRVRAPQRLDGDTDTWKAVTTGNNFACGITTAGIAKCWGLDSNGELGAGDTMPSTTPRAIDSTLAFDHIDSGAAETCAIATADHTLWCWGYGGWGQLGQGDYATHMSPVQVGSDTWLDVSLGDYVSCGVLATG